MSGWHFSLEGYDSKLVKLVRKRSGRSGKKCGPRPFTLGRHKLGILYYNECEARVSGWHFSLEGYDSKLVKLVRKRSGRSGKKCGPRPFTIGRHKLGILQRVRSTSDFFIISRVFGIRFKTCEARQETQCRSGKKCGPHPFTLGQHKLCIVQ